MTVRDFTQVFDAYAQSEEGLISALMNRSSDENEITEEGEYLNTLVCQLDVLFSS
jgi:hypothetical protein